MTPQRIFLALAILAPGFTPATAQQRDTLTLERAVALAIDNQPVAPGLRGRRSAAGAEFRQARAGFLPSIGFSASDTRTGGRSSSAPQSPPRRGYTAATPPRSREPHDLGFREDKRRVSQKHYLYDAHTATTPRQSRSSR